MALEFLKDILGAAYTEDVDKQISEAVGKRFVARDDYNTVNESKKALESRLKEASSTIDGFKAMDIEGVRKSADDWRAKAEQAQKDADAKIARMQFDAKLDGAIGAAHGKNIKAVRALLDVDALAGSRDQEADIGTALEGVRKDNAYLFGSDETPPPYSGGTGTKPAPNLSGKETMHKAANDALRAFK